MANRPAVFAEGLVKRFGDVRALDGVDLEVSQGTVLGLLGPNGAGKTTAVRVLTTLLKPDSGTARVAGLDVVKQAADLRERIGLAGQYAAGDELLTGDEADRLADEIAVIDRGHVIAEGEPDELKDRVGGERLEVVLTDSSMADRAAAALVPLCGEGPPVAEGSVVRLTVRPRPGLIVD